MFWAQVPVADMLVLARTPVKGTRLAAGADLRTEEQ
jgi:hypothetical protein